MEKLKVSEKYPSNLLAGVYGEDFENGWTRPNDFNASLEYALNTLTDRERDAMEYKYKYEMTLSQIGEIFEITRSRVGQIIAKASRKLLHPTRMKLVMSGVEVYLDYKRVLNKPVEDKEEEQGVAPSDVRDTELESLSLSVRSYNCLRRADVVTVRDIIKLFQTGDIRKVRNMGGHSVEEVRQKLLSIGVGSVELDFDEEAYKAKIADMNNVDVDQERMQEIEQQVTKLAQLKKEAETLPGWEFVVEAMRRIEKDGKYKNIVGLIVKVQDLVKDDEGSYPWSAYLEQIPPEKRWQQDYDAVDGLNGVSFQRIGFRKRETHPSFRDLCSMRVENLGLESAIVNGLRESGISNAGQCFASIAVGYPLMLNKYKPVIAARLIQIGLGTVSIKASPNPMGVLHLPGTEPFVENIQIDKENEVADPKYFIPVNDLEISGDLKNKAAYHGIKVAGQLCGLISLTSQNLKYKTNPFDWDETVSIFEALIKVGFTRLEINNPSSILKKVGEMSSGVQSE